MFMPRPLTYPAEMYQSPLYRSWSDMKTRCNNPKFKQYRDYGGRGIAVCKRWDGFAAFLEDMGPTWTPGMTLDRIDTDGDYGPGNCRWLTIQEQQSNKRNSTKVTFRGETRSLTEWARLVGIRPGTVRQRYYTYRWPIERCLTEGVGR